METGRIEDILDNDDRELFLDKGEAITKLPLVIQEPSKSELRRNPYAE